MKWFKHDGNARSDEKIEKMLMKYGVEGYGLYFYCLEIIAGNLAGDNITFELKHDAEVIAYRLKMDTLKVEEIIKWMVTVGLFQYNRETERIVCLGLAKRLDNTMSNNPEIKKMTGSDNFKKLKETSSNFKALEAEEIRLDETRKEEEREAKKSYAETVSLTEEEYKKLCTKYDEKDVKNKILALDAYQENKKHYKNHYKTLLNWLAKDCKEKTLIKCPKCGLYLIDGKRCPDGCTF